MKSQMQIIKNAVNSLFMESAMKKKGWTKQDATYVIVDWIRNGDKKSLVDFVNEYEHEVGLES